MVAAAKIGAPAECISSFQKDSEELEQGREREHQDGIHSLCSLRAALFGNTCVPNLRPAPQAEALGQAKRPPLQKDWGMFLSLLSVQCPVDVSLPGTISLIATVPWDSGMQVPPATRARGSRDQGACCGWQIQKPGDQMHVNFPFRRHWHFGVWQKVGVKIAPTL